MVEVTDPSCSSTRSSIIDEEKQREFKPNNQMFAAASVNSYMHANSSGSSSRRHQFRINCSPTNNYNGKPRPFSDHCKKPGHTKERCYRIHGYPQAGTTGNG
ncbi:hypothetical protein RDI58_029212 [Solanum bulbocastanum]|uniref:Uncharacterized protein n=1 Tax=Solanum bulbocastanum TaxID=147425 RepID=A0AAN8SR94_SOLBU